MAGMRPSLGPQLKMGQSLRLSPQVQQAIRLLSLSSLELREELQQMADENPLVELEAEGPEMAGDGLVWESVGSGSDDPDADDRPAEAERAGLREHLMAQVAGLHLPPAERAWLIVLCEALNDDGFLEDPLPDLAESVADIFEALGEPLPSSAQQILGLQRLQALDPTGVGARSLSECLLLQLRQGLSDQRIPPGRAAELAERLLTHHLDEMGSLVVGGLARRVGAPVALVEEAMALVRQLDPRPAARFSGDAAPAVLPDILVRRSRQGVWVPELTRSAQPRLRILPAVAEAVEGTAGPMLEKLQEARWMVRNLEQRASSLLRVAEAIVAEQQLFFELGPESMRPLILRDIAERVGLHESTVSRIARSKTLVCPRGTFELRYFFSVALDRDGAEATSSTAVKAQIRSWVEQEDPANPLSDQAMADRFTHESGTQIARRTIAKYREALRIPSASHRKQR